MKEIIVIIFLLAFITSLFKSDKDRDEPTGHETPAQYNARIDAERASNTGSQRTTRDNGNVHGAWAYTQQYVETQLKNPSSADFPFGGYRDVTYMGDNLYSFDSYVDSRNAYDAKIRTYFSGTIRRGSGMWTIESFYIK